MRTETTTVYIALDGMKFTDEKECKVHENALVETYKNVLTTKCFNSISGSDVSLMNGYFWGSEADVYITVDLSDPSVWDAVVGLFKYGNHTGETLPEETAKHLNEAANRGSYVVLDMYYDELIYIGTFDEIMLNFNSDIHKNFFCFD